VPSQPSASSTAAAAGAQLTLGRREDLEAALDAGGGVERGGGGEGGGLVAGLPEPDRERRERLGGHELLAAVLDVGRDAVLDGVHAGEQGGVRRQRGGHGDHEAVEDDGGLAEGVERRRGVAEVAVQAQVVGARGVERDDHDVGEGGGGGLRDRGRLEERRVGDVGGGVLAGDPGLGHLGAALLCDLGLHLGAGGAGGEQQGDDAQHAAVSSWSAPLRRRWGLGKRRTRWTAGPRRVKGRCLRRADVSSCAADARVGGLHLGDA
jgi:hypothetical protein